MKKKPLSSREEQILLLLQKFDFLTRDQINKCLRLGSTRNTNRVLSDLSKYLQCVRNGYQSIYYLNREGRLYVGCEKIRKKGSHVEHTIMRNDMWLHYGCPSDWKNELKIENKKTAVIADAMFNQGGFSHFLEVDHLQTMQENRLKIARYKDLMPSIALQLGHYPVLVWMTTTELRKNQLVDACSGLPNFKIYTMDDIQ
ncbi:replication-relaxation family protein [Lysinibacillus irui]|uniref:Replication-relaxation family protein n=1 Tax=Lysinibacillus irui TaxID=2998077 RepID=A0ABU5NQN9_9BACI|nr:replication-relaxation family protein [Lysinibacillus irui]MEA0556093.1 replication-relaxation family protein [Lysinibacillus irui]MEA0978347.1 replication-relaxation family protein [Lysinibacillus irui]MEA1044501.1 replication-relaxation family protein [Lysinibacillus irui]